MGAGFSACGKAQELGGSGFNSGCRVQGLGFKRGVQRARVLVCGFSLLMENALHHFISKMLKLWILALSRCPALKVKCVSLRWTKHNKEYVTVPLNSYHTTITGSLRYLSCTLNGMNIWKAR